MIFFIYVKSRAITISKALLKAAPRLYMRTPYRSPSTRAKHFRASAIEPAVIATAARSYCSSRADVTG